MCVQSDSVNLYNSPREKNIRINDNYKLVLSEAIHSPIRSNRKTVKKLEIHRESLDMIIASFA